MKTKNSIFFITITLLTIIIGCKKENGQVTFSSQYPATFTVTIDGETKTFTGASPTQPNCGTISPATATFSLPADTYTFTFVTQYGVSFPSQNSVTIAENGCASIHW